MAQIDTASAINEIRGKTNGKDSGYFYMLHGKQFYRNREENYQQNQSPKQKYNSAAFAYANAYMAEHYTTPEAKAQLAAEYEAAHRIASNGKPYGTPRSWKFNSLLYDYKQSHPCDE